MYKIKRTQAAEMLWVSTRSIDRYIKSWKLRSEKKWKNIYINTNDIKNLSNNTENTQEVIIPKIDNQEKNIDKNLVETKPEADKPNYIYKELIDTINRKDKKIEELSIKLGNAEQIVKNSISLIEFKKSQFLLEKKEESIRSELKEEVNNINKRLDKEKNINKILVIFLFILLITSIILWFSSI